MKKITVPVTGMHCASCAILIKKTLSKVEGVEEADSNYGSETATITYDEKKVCNETLQKAVNKFGYSLVFPDSKKFNQLKAIESHEANITFPIAIILFVVVLWESMAKFISLIPSFPIEMGTMSVILWIIATIVLFVFGRQFLQAIGRFIKYRAANMDTLVGLGTVAPYIYSSFIILFPEKAMVWGLGEGTYLDVTIIVIGFIQFGKMLETKTKHKTGEALEKLMKLQAKNALVRKNGQEIEVPIEDVKTGDIYIVKPSTAIPVDGEVIEGYSSIDEQMVTGESMPVDAEVGTKVIGGTMNLTGVIICKATKVGSDTVLSKITEMVKNAQSSKAPIERLADNVSGVFVPVVMLVSFLTFIAWLMTVGFTSGFEVAIPMALKSAIGVLVIACPCALGLATPTAIITAVGRGATKGILVKDAESLEKLGAINTVVMDKTGTLTEGKPVITEIKLFDTDIKTPEFIKILGGLEAYSEHPMAKAILKYAINHKLEIPKANNFFSHKGKGIEADINEVKYFAGTAKFISEKGIEITDSFYKQIIGKNQSAIFLATHKKLVGAVLLEDKIKENAEDTIKKLKELGIKTMLLSGDNINIASAVSKKLGMDEVIGGVLPDQKADKIREIKKEGKKVAMVGDGVNDAPALALSDVGIAMSTGTDVAISTANITLLHGDISKVHSAINLSNKTMSIVRQNLFWAFVYNIFGIPLAAGIFYPIFGWSLDPVFAGAAMALSSVSVVTNSLRLKRIKLL